MLLLLLTYAADRDKERPNIDLLDAMGSLLGKLVEVGKLGELPTAGQGWQELLSGDLGSIRTNLEKLFELYDSPLTVNYWMKDVRELSCDMEDFVYHIGADAEAGSVDGILKSFKSRIEELIERYKRYELEDVLGPVTNTVVSHRLASRERQPGDLVGMDDGPTNEVLRWLKPKGEKEKELKVGSILGAEGIGKSTLAQKLWREPELEQEFKCRAFVRTAKKPDMRMILRSILSQIRPTRPPEGCQVPSLIQDIRKHLQDKRFLQLGPAFCISITY